MVEKKLFPNHPHANRELRLEMSNLFRLLKEYLAQLSFKDLNLQKRIYLMDQLRKRKRDRVFQIMMKQTQELMEGVPYKDENYHYLHFQLAAVANGFYGQQGVRKFDPHLQEKMNHLDIHYFMLKLQESCAMLNRNRILRQDYQLNLIPEMQLLLFQSPV